jgi:hypothetical protein
MGEACYLEALWPDFNDHELSYLMLQENYLKTIPTFAADLQGTESEAS